VTQGKLHSKQTLAVTNPVCLKEVRYAFKRKFRRNLSGEREDKEMQESKEA